MSINFIQLQMQYFGDPTRNAPISNGFVYVGVIDTDPTVEANRITVTITEEDGTDVPILPSAQPLTLNAGGYIQYNGSPVQVNADSDFSITVQYSGGAQAFHAPRVSNTVAANIVTYDNSTSGLTATEVQSAIDELTTLQSADKRQYILYEPTLTDPTVEVIDVTSAQLGKDTAGLQNAFDLISIETGGDFNLWLTVSDFYGGPALAKMIGINASTFNVQLHADDGSGTGSVSEDVVQTVPKGSGALHVKNAAGVYVRVLNTDDLAAISNPIKAGAYITNPSAPNPTINNSLNIASITRVVAGRYNITFTTPMPDALYTVCGTPDFTTFPDVNMSVDNRATTGFSIFLFDVDTVTSYDKPFSFSIMDYS